MRLLILSLILCFSLVAPVFGGVDFNGDADYIDIGDLDISGSISVSMWVNVDVMPTSTSQVTLLDKGYNSDNQPYYFRLQEASGTDRLQCGNYANIGGDSYMYWNISGWNINEWHHVGYSCDTSTKIFKLYFDGALKATSSPQNQCTYANNISAQIGAGFFVDTKRHFLNGEITDFLITNSVLTDTDMLLLYSSEVKRLPLQLSPMAYYPLDQGEDGSALNTTSDFYKDLSGNGNHGTGIDADGDSLNIGESVLSYP